MEEIEPPDLIMCTVMAMAGGDLNNLPITILLAYPQAPGINNVQ
jgi:hypothetical protein